nr:hypothetical protein [Tanacetum cinerariifolium]
MLPIELTNEDIRNSEAYNEYYAVATKATPPKTKASVRKTKSSSDTTVTPPLTAAAGIRLSTSTKGKQPAKASKAKSPTVLSESSSVSFQFVTSMLNPTPDAGIDSIFETTSQMDVQAPTTVAPLPLSAPTLTTSTIATISIVPQAPTPPTTSPSTLLQDLPNFGSLFGFDHRLNKLEANFSEFVQTNQFAGAVSSIPGIAENEEFLKNLDENIQKIIKEQVKEQKKPKMRKDLIPSLKRLKTRMMKVMMKKILFECWQGRRTR